MLIISALNVSDWDKNAAQTVLIISVLSVSDWDKNAAQAVLASVLAERPQLLFEN